MSVLKVMFTAIVTAMTGVFALAAIGWLDLSQIYLVPTYVVPQLVGGVLFGAGFIVGGYCPGTSVAGMATGRIDAGVYALGILSGIALYAETFDALFADWAEATPLGQITLPALTGIAHGALVLAVAVIALGAFILEAALRRAR
jgi:hypothetical protein